MVARKCPQQFSFSLLRANSNRSNNRTTRRDIVIFQTYTLMKYISEEVSAGRVSFFGSRPDAAATHRSLHPHSNVCALDDLPSRVVASTPSTSTVSIISVLRVVARREQLHILR
jgi:hypothetical protein